MSCSSGAVEPKLGPFIVGPKIHRKNNSLVKCISEFFGRKPGSENILALKVLTVRRHGGSGGTAQDSEDVRSGRLLLHNEYNILGLLSDVPGVVHHHGLFRETSKLPEGGECERVILALDCCYPMPFGRSGTQQQSSYVNLQQYVIREKRLHERNAAILLYKIAKTVDMLHKRNVVHRDLKLCNMVLCLKSLHVTITNFSLSKLLVSDDELLRDQRGSLAYISPDVLSGSPFDGKASDMWAMGVLFYTMLYGQFPFYDSNPQELFKRISEAEYTIPKDITVSLETQVIIKQLLELDANKRLTASALLGHLEMILSRWSKSANYSEVPVVPEVSSPQERSTQARMNTVRPPPGLVFQCSSLLTDSHFDVRQAMQTPPTGVFDQGAAPWVLPQPSSPGMYLPPSSPLSVVFVQPIIATSPMPFLPQSSGGFVPFEPNLSASRQVPTTAVLSGMSTVSTSTPPTPSPATFANSADWLSNVTSHNDEPPLQGLPFLSRRESTAMQATASDSSGASHRERHSPTLSLALPSSGDLVQQSEPAVTSPACPSTPILSQIGRAHV